jgi:hypothetical protein
MLCSQGLQRDLAVTRAIGALYQAEHSANGDPEVARRILGLRQAELGEHKRACETCKNLASYQRRRHRDALNCGNIG